MQQYKEIITKLYAKINNSDQKKNKGLNKDILRDIKRDFAKKYGLSTLVSNTKLLRIYHSLCKQWIFTLNKKIEAVLRKRWVRSQSWIVPVQVLTKPFRCPWKCIFCPNDPTMPKSYIKTEPGAMRALLNKFDPKKQAYNRLLSLTLTWHPTDKIEMIVLWWTRDVYPKEYKQEFIKWLYDACNTFSIFFNKVQMDDVAMETKSENKFSFKVDKIEEINYPKTLEESIKLNETAKNRIIWLTIETRPEYVNDKNCQLRRDLWITRLEIWVQSTFDTVLKKNKRWHTIETIRCAIHTLRRFWFKFSIHIMPGLYGSTIRKDISTLRKIFSDSFIKPDEIKFYPTSVIPDTELYNLYKSWKYKPLTTKQIQKIIKKLWLDFVPPYTRIKRLIRDIPSTEIEAGSIVTNLSQITSNLLLKQVKEKKLNPTKLYKRLYSKYRLYSDISEFLIQDQTSKIRWKKIVTSIIWENPDLKTIRNFISLDTRSREIRNRKDKNQKPNSVNLVIRRYISSVWTEFFISFEDLQGYLYWFTRLLLPKNWNEVNIPGLWKKTAIIRELHIYWKMVTLQKKENQYIEKTQHKWFGKQLMELAEQLSSSQNFTKLSVISGIWVREYYKKLWYNLEWTYMVKKLHATVQYDHESKS